MATHCSILAAVSQGQRRLAGYSHRVRKIWTQLKQLSTHIILTVAQEITKCEDVLKYIRLL